MLNIKKISPTEFRLHNKLFHVAYTPSNYFEPFRLEIVFQYLLMWFFEEFGIYFYIQKLKFIDETILFQLYYYKTYMTLGNVRSAVDLKESAGVETYMEYPERFETTLNLRYYNRNLLNYFVKYNKKSKTYKVKQKASNFIYGRFMTDLKNKLKMTKAPEVNYETKTEAGVTFIDIQPAKPIVKHKKKRFAGKSKKKSYTPRWLTNKKSKVVTKGLVKRSIPTMSFNFFFTYFFLHFFKYSSVILYKSLYKMVFANRIYKDEHSKLLYKTRYLQNSLWVYDIYFFMNYALTYANTTFLFPFFVYHLTEKYKQKRTIISLFNLLRVLYYYKLNIRGIKILVNGPYDRHGRSRHLVLKIGDISLTEYRSYIMYDSIQCPTLYGTINIKLWVHYTDANVELNIKKIDVAIPRRTS